MNNRKRNTEARVKALRLASEKLGIGPLSAEDEATDLLLDRAADHLRERNFPFLRAGREGPPRRDATRARNPAKAVFSRPRKIFATCP
jgi:hypothetical protein